MSFVKSNQEKRTSVIVRLCIAAGVVIIALNLFQLFMTITRSTASVIRASESNYKEISIGYAASIQNRLRSFTSELDFYLKADVVQNGEPEEIIEWLIEHEKFRNEDFDYIMFGGSDGIMHTDIGTSTDVSSRPYFSAIMREGKDVYIGNPVISKTSGNAVVHVARAVKRNGRNWAFFAGVVSVNLITKEVNEAKIGKNGNAWLVGNDGLLFAHKNKDFIMKRNLIKDLGDDRKDMKDAIQSLISGNSGSTWVKGIGNSERDLLIYTPISGSTWGFGIAVPESDTTALVVEIRNLLIISSIFTIILLMIIIGIMTRKAIKPLKIVEDAITGIARGDADLTRRIELDSTNEIGWVVKGFNDFSQKLQTIISDVKSSKKELGIVGEDLTASTEDTASAITQIIANIDSMKNQIMNQSASVEETAGAVNQIASNIESLERMIENQSAGVSQASAAVEEMIGNISSVNQSVEKMAGSFESLRENANDGIKKQFAVNEKIVQIEEQSKTLQEANKTIAQIANETNLLAMNAAIEAAHAGDSGRGFSVVADEIRKLSETSREQSKTIGEQLKKIKDSISGVVSASRESSESFKIVGNKINETDELVIQIKSAMEEQNEGSKQISDALHTMNDGTVEVRNASAEMTAGNRAILEEIQNLQNSTTVMKESMNEMGVGARKINETGASLSELSTKVRQSIDKIGLQIDQFKV